MEKLSRAGAQGRKKASKGLNLCVLPYERMGLHSAAQSKHIRRCRLLSRRRFLENASLIAGSMVVPNSALAGVSGASQNPAMLDSKLLDRAKELLQRAPLIDTHNDLPSVFLETKAGDLTSFDMSKAQPKLCADIPSLREGRVGAQYWSIFVESATQNTHTSLHEAMREFDVALRFIQTNADLEQARTADDIERIHKSGRIACLLGVEGGHMIENSAAALRNFCALGARYMTLTHWDNIDWADSATDRPEHYGLTEFGERVVKEMNRLGMFVDLSHVSADTMRDALHVTRAPVIFSHSNAFAIDPHPRCVPDQVLALVPANGGVVHVNFIPAFISPKAPAWQAKRTAALKELHARLDSDKAIAKGIADWDKANPGPRGSISEVADHIDHIRKVAGVDHIGIGADYYDVNPESMVLGLENVTRYPYLFAELLRRGYSDDEVLKIAGRNHLRAMRQMESVSAQLQKSEEPLITEGLVAKWAL
jgi:membrane dipeptidase